MDVFDWMIMLDFVFFLANAKKYVSLNSYTVDCQMHFLLCFWPKMKSVLLKQPVVGFSKTNGNQ